MILAVQDSLAVVLQFALYGALYSNRKWLKESGFVAYFLSTKKPIQELY
jgi:hypothetical protein